MLLRLLPIMLFAAVPATPGGLYAAQGTSIGEHLIWLDSRAGSTASLVSRSPDGRSTLSIRFRATDNGQQLTRYRLSGLAGTAEMTFDVSPVGDIVWSPDSTRVALSLSGGGLGGTYDLVLFDRSGHRILSAPFRKALNPPKACDLRDFASVAAVKWLSDSRLLVVAHQSHRDSCPQRSRAVFYDYDLRTNRILRSYTPAQVRRVFPRALGDLLS